MYYRAPKSILHDAPIYLTSTNLTRIDNALIARKEDRMKFGNEYRALARQENPSIRAVTNTSYDRPVAKATFDTRGQLDPSNATTEAPGESDAAKRFAEDVARMERNEPIADLPDIKTQMANVARKAQATEVVIEKLEAEFQAEWLKLAAAHCKTLKADHDKKTRRFFELFTEAYSVFADLQKTKQDLIGSQIGFGGLFNVDLEVMRSNDVASMFHDAVKAGYISSVPKGLQ